MKTIPFTLSNGLITVRAAIGGVEGNFVVDTGCGLTTLDTGWAHTIGISPDADSPRFQAHGTDSVDAAFATIPSLRIAGVVLGAQKVVLVPLDGIADGILGFDFLSRWIVDIDHAARVITLHDAAQTLLSVPGDGTDRSATVVPVSLQYRIPIVDATIVPRDGVALPARLVLDLGSSHLCARLLAGFVARHPEILDDAIEAPIGTGVGGIVHGRLRRVGEIRLGDLRIARPTTGIATDARGAMGLAIFDGTLGMPFFQRTRMILDYAHERVIFEPRADFDAPYEHDMSGLTLMRRNGVVTVIHVLPNSPAGACGMMAGDVLADVDDLDALDASLREDGAERRMMVRRGDETHDVRMQLRRLV